MITSTKKIVAKRTVLPKTTVIERPKKKSGIALFREKYPYGLGYEIVDMERVLT